MRAAVLLAMALIGCGTDDGVHAPASSNGGTAGAGGDGGWGGPWTGGHGGGTGGRTGRHGPGELGAACDAASPCEPALFCLGPSTPGGGPAHGLCTLECTQDADVCEQHEVGALCAPITTDGNMYCVQGCDAAPTQGVFDPEKCRGRPDMACAVAPSMPRCVPNCNADADCPEDAFCSPKSGLCQSDPPSGAESGATCSDSSQCRGACVKHGGASVCADRCTIGAVPQCGWAGPGTGAPAFCLPPGWPSGEVGVGDLGTCHSLCECKEDCAVAAMSCELLLEGLPDALGKAGACVPTTQSASTLPSCP